MTTKVFISYSHADAEFARNLSKMFNEIDVDWFLDEKDLQIGTSIKLAVHSGLRSCTELIVVISPASFKSTWVSFEIGQATALGKTILPIIIHPNMDLPDFIKELKYANTTDQIRDYFLQKNAKQSKIQAVILGASTSGTRMLELLLQMNIIIAGVYDKRPEAEGLDLAREHRIIPYYGSTMELLRLIKDCQKNPSVFYHFLLTSEHQGFVTYVNQHWQESQNCVLHRMGVDFPSAFTNQEISRLLNQ